MRLGYLRNGIILFIFFLIFAWISIEWGMELAWADLILLIVSIYFIGAGLIKSEPMTTQKLETTEPVPPPVQTQTPTSTYQTPPPQREQPQPPTPKCPTCGYTLTFLEQDKRWYCQNENRIVFPTTTVASAIPTPPSQTAPAPLRTATYTASQGTVAETESPTLPKMKTRAGQLSRDQENAKLLESLKKRADEGEISEESYETLQKELRSKEERIKEKQELQQDLDLLDKRLIEGKISETTYNALKEKLQSKLNKL
jgi:hypothetical protein